MESADPTPNPPVYRSQPAADIESPILNWWAGVPALVFVAVEVIFGWPAANAQAKAPSDAVAYLVGGIVGGLLISFLVAWIVYRIGSRTTLGGTIAFSIMVGLFSLGAVNAARAKTPVDPGSLPAAAPTMASFADFSFEIPTGWTKVDLDRDKTRAMIVLNPQAVAEPDGLLKVDVGTPASQNALSVAQSLAGADGKILSDHVAVDGVPGVRVETPSLSIARPRLAVVVYHDGRCYLIMAAGRDASDVISAYDSVLKSWRWNQKGSR